MRGSCRDCDGDHLCGDGDVVWCGDGGGDHDSRGL